MRIFTNRLWLSVMLALVVSASAMAEVVFENGRVVRGQFKLKDGTTLSGEVISPKGDGVVFKTDKGYSPRYKWEQFSQESLKEFLKDSRVKQFVEVLIEIPPEELSAAQDESIPERKPRPPLDIQPVPSAGREFTGASLFGALLSGPGLLFLLLIYAANLYAGYEIAYYRNYHFAIVCGTAVVLPVIGPFVFLCMKTRSKQALVESSGESGDSTLDEDDEEEAGYAEGTPAYGEAVPAYAEAVPVEAVHIPPTQVFKRGEVVLNRRFIETKFAPFFRVIIGDTEKDLRLVVKSSKGQYVGNRISKVTQTDLTLQITENGISTEEHFPITDIFEIQIRHKDAPPQ